MKYKLCYNITQLAVYFEKFEKNELVKMSGKEFDMIKVGIVNTYVF